MGLENLLKEANVDFKLAGEHHHARIGWVQFDCPNCGPDSKRYHAGYNIYYHYINCWKCGRLNLRETLLLITGMSWGQISGYLTDGETLERKKEQWKGRLELPKGLIDLEAAHIKYLKGRGFEVDHLKEVWGIRGIGIHAYLSWRIFIPIHLGGKVVSWTTRSVSRNASSRYISAKKHQELVSHKTLLYGEQYCRHSCIVHEGPFDVWKTGPGALATCGTSITNKQIARIANYPIRAICFDNEIAAQRRARRLCETLKSFPGETYEVVLKAKDAGSASKHELKELRSRFLE